MALFIGMWRVYQADGTEGYPGYEPVPGHINNLTPVEHPPFWFGRNRGREDVTISRIVFELDDGRVMLEAFVNPIVGLVIPAEGRAGVF